jgi:hypothetical protein
MHVFKHPMWYVENFSGRTKHPPCWLVLLFRFQFRAMWTVDHDECLSKLYGLHASRILSHHRSLHSSSHQQQHVRRVPPHAQTPPLGNNHTTPTAAPPRRRVVLCRGHRVCILLLLGTACISHQPSGNSSPWSPHTACAGWPVTVDV